MAGIEAISGLRELHSSDWKYHPRLTTHNMGSWVRGLVELTWNEHYSKVYCMDYLVVDKGSFCLPV